MTAVAGLFAASSPLRYCPPQSARTGQSGTQHRGQSGSRPGNAPVLGASHGFSRLWVAGVLRFICGSVWVCAASERLWDGVSLGFLLGFACSSPVRPLLGFHFRPFPTIRILGYSLPLQELGNGPIVAGLPALPDPATGGCFSLFALCSWRGSLASS